MNTQIKQQIEQEAIKNIPEFLYYDEEDLRIGYNEDIPVTKEWTEWYHNNIKENVNVDWNKLREEFFDEHVEKNTGGYISISTAPHDLFEWFKSKLSASNQEKNNKTYCDCEVGKCEGGKQDRCAFIHAKPNRENNDDWIDFTKTYPKEYGRYLVYRGGKVHFQTWNNTGWAYNHNSITHWKQINPPKDK